MSGSAWLLFIGIATIIGSIVYYNVALRSNIWGGLGILLGAWVVGGIMGYIGFLALTNALKIERLRLAAHMLRSLSLHAAIASEKNNEKALHIISEAERKEADFIARAFRAAGVNVEQAFVQGAVESVKRGTEPPYILVYRNGVLDAPATLVANLTARTAGAILGIFAFILLGLIMLAIGIIVGSVFVYTTARTLKKHAVIENRIRRLLGLKEVPVEGPGLGGLIASILTGGLYLPIYARNLTEGINSHILTH